MNFVGIYYKKLNAGGLNCDKVITLLQYSLCKSDESIRVVARDLLLPSIIKTNPMVLEKLLNGQFSLTPEFLLKDNTSVLWLESIICILRTAKSTGIQLSFFDNVEVYEKIMKYGITNVSDRVRFSSLCLITESHKIMYPVSAIDLDLVKRYLCLNSSQSTDIRQKLIFQLKRFLVRLQKLLYSDWKEVQNCQKKLLHTNEVMHKSINDQIRNAELRIRIKHEFFKWLFKINIFSLYPGSSQHRTSTHLSIFALNLEIQQMKLADTNNLDLIDMSGFLIRPDAQDHSALLSHFIFDTHESNRLTILQYFGNINYNEEEPGNAEFLLSLLPGMLSSMRASEIESGAFLARFIFVRYISRGYRINAASFCKETNEYTKLGSTELYIQKLSDMLESHIKISRISLARSSRNAPMNGILAAIVQVLRTMDLTSQWTGPISEIILKISNQCEDCCNVVLDICSHSSPEGNIPASFEQMGVTVSDIMQAANSTEDDTLAQVILRHCFRTIKEATDCVVLIVESIPAKIIQCSKRLIEFVENIGDLLCRISTLLRHRGALSAAHESFSHICKYFAQSGVTHLESCLEKWLNFFLRQIISTEVSVTRRSAGLPLAILCILSADIKSNQKLVENTLEHLFEIINKKVFRNEQTDLAQVHALNILKILVQDSELVLSMRTYIGQIFQMCVMQFKSPYFPIKNCAGMLFSAVIDKVFGSSKSKDQLNKSNLVSSKEFFGLYPQMYTLLYSELNLALLSLKKVKKWCYHRMNYTHSYSQSLASSHESGQVLSSLIAHIALNRLLNSLNNVP